MKVNDLLDRVGRLLQEDFTASPIWTKEELFGYLKTTLRVFYELTHVVDKNMIVLVDGTSGESIVPVDFGQLFYVQFDQKPIDIVVYDELDFIEEAWLYGEKGKVRGATVYGSGQDAKVRFVPVPSEVHVGIGAGSVAVLRMSDGAVVWDVRTTNGVLVSTVSVGSVSTPVIAGPSTFWDLSINSSGELVTNASASVVGDDILLADNASSNLSWRLVCTDLGELVTIADFADAGLAVAATLNGTANYQEFLAGSNSSNANYGVIVDAYETLDPPTHIARVNAPIGCTLFSRTSDKSGLIWYTANLPAPGNYLSEVWLSPGLEPVIIHGILAHAFGHDGDGKDLMKSRMLMQVFEMECKSIRDIFQGRFV